MQIPCTNAHFILQLFDANQFTPSWVSACCALAPKHSFHENDHKKEETLALCKVSMLATLYIGLN